MAEAGGIEPGRGQIVFSKKRCKRFLKANGWEYDAICKGGGGAYISPVACCIEVQDDEIVFIDDTGDFLHIPTDYYALIGALLETRQIGAGYVSTK
ncbi:hypothetical protein [Desulfovibrio gilichinskyi]|uniref:Uncharacterized protein n=1 Tax=Desulfovibrio gilichinskyi TaxID=1519643 RepID=A0A1X7C3D3_9BACT|nr:hypothetical protein [Desulfovibrio gilichinskyi]SME89320.1 hypothetical protein SAMN06295933_0272 [Desulfovibrio gilichinskyi]